jgi:predicted NUDIX family NTP pyrophosphohydrolase
MAKISAGLLLYRRRGGELEVFLVHPGGPFWARKDLGAWSIPKGEVEPGEDTELAARREFTEETGCVPAGDLLALDPQKQRSGKLVHAWALEGDCDPEKVSSNRFSLEWPPRSGQFQEFPEVDRAAWFPIAAARDRIVPGQRSFLIQLADRLRPRHDI